MVGPDGELVRRRRPKWVKAAVRLVAVVVALTLIGVLLSVKVILPSDRIRSLSTPWVASVDVVYEVHVRSGYSVDISWGDDHLETQVHDRTTTWTLHSRALRLATLHLRAFVKSPPDDIWRDRVTCSIRVRGRVVASDVAHTTARCQRL